MYLKFDNVVHQIKGKIAEIKTLAAIMRNIPEIIYKYRSWKNIYHKKSLTSNQIYFASPSEFNDPFDCNITVDYSELNNAYKIFEYATSIVVNATKRIEMTKDEMIKEVYRVAEIISKEKDTLQCNNNQFIIDKINEHLGIFSGSIICDNFLLWSHYSDSHRGFCIGYDVIKVRNSIDKTNGGHVHYSDDYPKISPINEVELLSSWIQVNYKAECWAYEKEFRISKLYTQNRLNQNRVSVVADDCIKEIILGASIDKTDREEIIDISREKKIDIYQMIRIPNTFRLQKEIL